MSQFSGYAYAVKVLELLKDDERATHTCMSALQQMTKVEQNLAKIEQTLREGNRDLAQPEIRKALAALRSAHDQLAQISHSCERAKPLLALCKGHMASVLSVAGDWDQAATFAEETTEILGQHSGFGLTEAAAYMMLGIAKLNRGNSEAGRENLTKAKRMLHSLPDCPAKDRNLAMIKNAESQFGLRKWWEFWK